MAKVRDRRSKYVFYVTLDIAYMEIITPLMQVPGVVST